MTWILSRLAVLLVGIVAGVTLPFWLEGMGIGKAPRTSAGSTALEAVRSLATLTTQQVRIADVQVAALSGYVGGMRVVVLVQGEFSVEVDLSRAYLSDVDSVHRQAVLHLPVPKPGPARIDLIGSKVLAVQVDGLWQIVPGGISTGNEIGTVCYRAAQKSLQKVSHEPRWTGVSQRQTEQLIEPFCKSLGWQMTVKWEG